MKAQIVKLLEILNDLYGGKFIPTDLKNYVDKIFDKSSMIILQKEGKLQGFISYYDNDATLEVAYLTMIAIDLNFKSLGLGSRLLEFSIQDLKNKGFKKYRLEVLKENNGAIDLYKKFGFEEVKREGEMLRMEKLLLC